MPQYIGKNIRNLLEETLAEIEEKVDVYSDLDLNYVIPIAKTDFEKIAKILNNM